MLQAEKKRRAGGGGSFFSVAQRKNRGGFERASKKRKEPAICCLRFKQRAHHPTVGPFESGLPLGVRTGFFYPETGSLGVSSSGLGIAWGTPHPAKEENSLPGFLDFVHFLGLAHFRGKQPNMHFFGQSTR